VAYADCLSKVVASHHTGGVSRCGHLRVSLQWSWGVRLDAYRPRGTGGDGRLREWRERLLTRGHPS
jgi:hypothetical protein